MLKVNRRNGFSDRNGIDPINTNIQLDDFDVRTRNRLINLVNSLYNNVFSGDGFPSERKEGFLRFLFDNVYAIQIKFNPFNIEKETFSLINETILNDKVDAVLTLIEAIAQYMDDYLTHSLGQRYVNEIGCTKIYKFFNDLFECEYVGYRFIGDTISPISNELEVEEIRTALKNPFEAVREHVSKANYFLSNRKNPDYENSIKESISAVEAVCQELMETKKTTLGKMLKHIEDCGVNIHFAMKEAFGKLYGYTSDANGIRHAGDIGGPSSTFEEAKFMLVSCSAFINYLIGVSEKIKKYD